MRCHTVDALGGNAGPNLSNVAARLSLPKLVESVVEPGAEIAPGFGAVSAMPKITDFLAPRDVRNVVAYLQTLKPAQDEHAHVDQAPPRGSDTRPIAVVLMAILGVGVVCGWRRAD